MNWLTGLFTDSATAPAAWGLAILVVILLVIIGFARVRRLRDGLFMSGGRQRRHRLAVLDATAIDNRRRLVLVRRDDVEHLILIGGSNDVIVEAGIEPAAAQPRQSGQPAAHPAPAPGGGERHAEAQRRQPAPAVQRPTSRPAGGPGDKATPPAAAASGTARQDAAGSEQGAGPAASTPASSAGATFAGVGAAGAGAAAAMPRPSEQAASRKPVASAQAERPAADALPADEPPATSAPPRPGREVEGQGMPDATDDALAPPSALSQPEPRQQGAAPPSEEFAKAPAPSAPGTEPEPARPEPASQTPAFDIAAMQSDIAGRHEEDLIAPPERTFGAPGPADANEDAPRQDPRRPEAGPQAPAPLATSEPAPPAGQDDGRPAPFEPVSPLPSQRQDTQAGPAGPAETPEQHSQAGPQEQAPAPTEDRPEAAPEIRPPEEPAKDRPDDLESEMERLLDQLVTATRSKN